MTMRTKKVESLMQREIGDMIQKQEIHDPRIGFVTVTKVDVSPDMKNAKVYVSVLGEKKEQKRSLSGLINARKFIQGELARRIRMKYFPELKFSLDDSIKYSDEVNGLINKIHEDKPYTE